MKYEVPELRLVGATRQIVLGAITSKFTVGGPYTTEEVGFDTLPETPW